MSIEAMKQALEALEKITSNNHSFAEKMQLFADAITSLHQAIAEAEKLTTTRNAWTGRATYKCNLCGRDDFRSEHGAKFHECQAIAEAEKQEPVIDKAAAIRIATSLGWEPQRQPLTDEQIMSLCAAEWASHPIEVARVIEAAHGIKEKNNG